MKGTGAYLRGWVDEWLRLGTSGGAMYTQHPYWIADAFVVTLASGTVLYLTNAPDRLYAYSFPYATLPGGTVYYETTLIRRGPYKAKVGMQVDDMELVFQDRALMLDGKALVDAVNAGALDNATIQAITAVILKSNVPGILPPNDRFLFGTVNQFIGRVSDVEVDYEGVRVKVRSQLELLNVRMPRYVFQPGCQHTLFDNRCALVKSSWGAASTAASGSTTTTINSAHAQASGYFDLGTVEFTSGANSGQKRSVKSYTPGVFVLSNPLPNTPTVGDAFTAYPGCDKRKTTCSTKFSNLAKHRAFPYVPTPETAY